MTVAAADGFGPSNFRNLGDAIDCIGDSHAPPIDSALGVTATVPLSRRGLIRFYWAGSHASECHGVP